MANESDGGTMECIFQWKVANASQCWWLKKGKWVNSPTFVVKGQAKTKWSLRLFLIGENKDTVDVYLHREMDCSGPRRVEVEYKLEFLGKDGVISENDMKMESFDRCEDSIAPITEDLESVFSTDRETSSWRYLTVRCQLRNVKRDEGRKGLVKSEHLYARTVLNASRKSFHWIIGKFSTLPPGVIRKYEDDLLKISLILNENSGKNLRVNVLYLDFVKCIWGEVSITDSEGKKKRCAIFTGYDSTTDILADIPKEFVENKNRYLPNDELSLNFDFVLSTIEHSETMGYSTKQSEQEKYGNVTFLINDLKFMYNDQILSDVELRTSTKTFPAHKNILSARSPVFRRMFSRDMKEKNSGQVDIDDLEDDTIHRMLLFMYSGLHGELQFGSASELYTAADKYEILSLKGACSSFMKDNLRLTTACKVLLLADQHQDADLRKAAIDYIMEHREVFKTVEWKNFMDTNPELAADIMHK